LRSSLLSAIRGPKKKADAAVEISTDYINIFKDKSDPVKISKKRNGKNLTSTLHG